MRQLKQLGGRKDQRFLGKAAERQSIGRLIILSVNEKHWDFLGPRRCSPDRTLALILTYFVSGVSSLPNSIFYQNHFVPMLQVCECSLFLYCLLGIALTDDFQIPPTSVFSTSCPLLLHLELLRTDVGFLLANGSAFNRFPTVSSIR